MRSISSLLKATVVGLVVFGAMTVSAVAQTGASITIEGLALWRDDPASAAFTGSSAGGATVFTLDADDFDFDASAGIRGLFEVPANSLGGFLPPGWALQIGGMWVDQFDDNLSGNDPGEDTDTTYSSDLGGIVSAGLSDGDAEEIGAARIGLETRLAGGEVNVAAPEGGAFGGKVFGGFRYIHYSEDLNGTVFDDFPAGSDTDNHLINIETTNNLYGAQVGWEGYVPIAAGIRIGGRVAGGLFANDAERDRSLVDQDTPGNRLADTRSETELAQMLEASPRILFDLTNSMQLSLGGTVIWLNDVSQASQHWSNMLNRGDRDVRADDDVVFYGVTAGLKVKLN